MDSESGPESQLETNDQTTEPVVAADTDSGLPLVSASVIQPMATAGNEPIIRKAVAGKHSLREPCNCKRLKCYSLFSAEERKKLWLSYWSLDYAGQRLFLAKQMTACKIVQNKPMNPEHKNRNAFY